MMSNVFLVCSAIGKNYGVFSLEERYSQLLETIHSVKKHAPKDDIFLVETSKELLDDAKMAELNSLCVVNFIKDDPVVNLANNVQERYPDSNEPWNFNETKTVGEIRATQFFLDLLKKQNKTYNRVFKISGRYSLNDNFNLADYDQHAGKLVFKSNNQHCNLDSMSARLWSFDYKMLDSIISMLDGVFEMTINELNRYNTFTIVERSFYQQIRRMNLPFIKVPTLGISGYFGLDGRELDE